VTPPAPVVAVATSGGRDSTALLHATCRAARALGLRVVALHVHHGLQPQADDWVRHLRRQVSRWHASGLPVVLRVQRLAGQPAPGESTEAWARRHRYAALAAMARDAGAGLVLLAHHQADQAETVLLQALRLGSPAGLSAMPPVVQREGLVWARPWLGQPSEAVAAYVQRHRLCHVQDLSNHDERLARNRLRRQVLPALEAAFPGAQRQLAALARRQQEAAACLAELADADLQACRGEGGTLRLDAWAALSEARRAQALRRWLQAWLPKGVPETLVHRLCAELPASRGGARWPAGDGWLQRHRRLLRAVPR
jgi:tRNA(Ile)-lysidine synthase